jgi:hypothetical protein
MIFLALGNVSVEVFRRRKSWTDVVTDVVTSRVLVIALGRWRNVATPPQGMLVGRRTLPCPTQPLGGRVSVGAAACGLVVVWCVVLV